MARFFLTALAALLAAAATPAARAFSPNHKVGVVNTHLQSARKVDFDAPIPYNPQSGTTVLDQAPVVDDECYMGAQGDATDCVDFDPPTSTRRRTRSGNAQDKPRSAPKWTKGEVDFDAPMPYNPQSGTTSLNQAPVVDDECYMGAQGDATDCVDFDPPTSMKRRTRSGNAQDKPRSAPKWTIGDDFDAPIPSSPQSGTTVLNQAPVVDDECYMGAQGDATDCVDFDPPKQVNLWTNVLDTPKGKKQRELPKWAQKKR